MLILLILSWYFHEIEFTSLESSLRGLNEVLIFDGSIKNEEFLGTYEVVWSSWEYSNDCFLKLCIFSYFTNFLQLVQSYRLTTALLSIEVFGLGEASLPSIPKTKLSIQKILRWLQITDLLTFHLDVKSK